jgi:hypothetical protein
MNTDQVSYESRFRERFAVISAIAGVLLVGSAILQLSGPHTSVDELTLDLITAHKRFPLDLIGAVLDGLGLFALAATLNWLSRISRARNPEQRDFVRWLAVVGAIVSGLMAVGYAVVIASKAADFVNGGNQTYVQANHLTTGGLIVALPLLAQFGSLLLTGGFIWISLNALKVGLLTRFMGYLGVFAGALVLFPIGSPVPVVQGFWLVSLAIMYAGRWPAGQPPAWEAGVAIPWAPVGQAQGGKGRGGGARPAPGEPRPSLFQRQRKPQPVTVAEPAPAAEDPMRTRANTPKRKRKRRN